MNCNLLLIIGLISQYNVSWWYLIPSHVFVYVKKFGTSIDAKADGNNYVNPAMWWNSSRFRWRDYLAKWSHRRFSNISVSYSIRIDWFNLQTSARIGKPFPLNRLLIAYSIINTFSLYKNNNNNNISFLWHRYRCTTATWVAELPLKKSVFGSHGFSSNQYPYVQFGSRVNFE